MFQCFITISEAQTIGGSTPLGPGHMSIPGSREEEKDMIWYKCLNENLKYKTLCA